MATEREPKPRPLMRRPAHWTVCGRRGERRPLSRRFGRALLPPHWSARWDAERLAALREELRLLLALETLRPANMFFW